MPHGVCWLRGKVFFFGVISASVDTRWQGFICLWHVLPVSRCSEVERFDGGKTVWPFSEGPFFLWLLCVA